MVSISRTCTDSIHVSQTGSPLPAGTCLSPLSRSVLFPLVLFSFFIFSGHCTSLSTSRKSIEQGKARLAGRWNLDREATVRFMVARAGGDFDHLESQEQRRKVDQLDMEFTIQFLPDGSWKGAFSSDGNQTMGEGTYRILSYRSGQMRIRTTEFDETAESSPGENSIPATSTEKADENKDSSKRKIKETQVINLRFLAGQKVLLWFEGDENSIRLILVRKEDANPEKQRTP